MPQAVDPQQELAWVSAAQAGDTHAFEELVRAYQGPVYTVAYRLIGHAEEAKDIAQEAFVKAYRALGTFRGDSRWSTWLFSIVMNTARNRRRALGSRRWFTTDSLDAPAPGDSERPRHQPSDPRADPAQDAITNEQRQLLREGIQSMEPHEREVIVLRDMQGLSYQEIADILGCRVGTVKSRLHRARTALVERMRQVTA